MPENKTIMGRLVKTLRRAGLIRVRDLQGQGIHPEYLRRLCQKGLVVRVGRGLYRSAHAQPTAQTGLAQVAKRVPQAVVCLLSALQFHEIGTQSPPQVWVALDRRLARPRLDYPPLRVLRFSGPALTAGVETHMIEGVPVKVYTPAKTVADCFKYRNKIGLDVALEALRDALRRRKCKMDALWRCAKVCRVTNVMRPYLEALA